MVGATVTALQFRTENGRQFVLTTPPMTHSTTTVTHKKRFFFLNKLDEEIKLWALGMWFQSGL